MDFKTRKIFYNRCFPDEPLLPEDERNVDLDLLGERSGLPVRGVNWTDQLAEEIGLSDRPVFKLFTGLSGSGKTTELRRLAKRLSNPEESNLFPVFINAGQILDFSSPITAIDLLLPVVNATEYAICEKNEKTPDEILEKSFLVRLWEWLTVLDSELNQGEFVIESERKLLSEMKARPRLRERVRDIIQIHFPRFLNQCHDQLTRLNKEVAEKFQKGGIVIVFDSLEKLSGVTSNSAEVLDSCERVFGPQASYLKLPVHAVYTVPVPLSTRLPNIDFLPVIKVRGRDNTPYEPGIYAARELILKRVPRETLEAILGPNTNSRMDRLILCSGGCLGEIVQMLQMVLAQKKYPMGDSAFEHIIIQMANRFKTIVSPNDAKWLAKVAHTRYLPLQDEKDRKKTEFALAHNIVLRYLNDDLWYNLHPSVAEIQVVQTAMKEISNQ